MTGSQSGPAKRAATTVGMPHLRTSKAQRKMIARSGDAAIWRHCPGDITARPVVTPARIKRSTQYVLCITLQNLVNPSQIFGHQNNVSKYVLCNFYPTLF